MSLQDKLGTVLHAINEVEAELAALRDRESDLATALAELSECPQCETGSDSEGHDVVWCENCGRIGLYHLEDRQVHWIDPVESSVTDWEELPVHQRRVVGALWTNEASEERRKAILRPTSFNPNDCSGVFDGVNSVQSDADPGL
jgi:hypothetical protein